MSSAHIVARRFPLVSRAPRKARRLFRALLCGVALAVSLSNVGQAAPSSFIGMGVTTGSPSGDVQAAITPVLQPIEMPERVAKEKIAPEMLFDVTTNVVFPRSMRIGVQASLARSAETRWLRYTVEEIRHAFGADHVNIMWLDDRGVELGAKSGQLDFIIADANIFALAQTSGSYEALSTFLPIKASRAEDAQASVIFTQRESRLKAVTSLGTPDVTFAAMDSTGLTTWLAPLAQMQLRGLSGTAVQERTAFYGNSPDAVVHAVLSGAQTVGILPACLLENLEREGRISIPTDISVIAPHTDDTLRCLHTTMTYPGWTVGAMQTIDPAWKKAMSTVLFSMSTTEHEGEWAMPAINRMVYDMFYELKMGPYEHLATWSFDRFLRRNSEFLALGLLIACVVIVFLVTLSVMVRIKTSELRKALEERDVIEAEAAQSRQHIANLERTGIVGQMSTIIAHELKQPLAAIANFANSLNRRTKKGNFDEGAFTFALGEIIAQADRANEIVNRVRAYAKHDYPPRKETDLHDVVNNAITAFRRARQTKADLLVRVPRGSMAEVDAWEIELAVLNLMKNAADAITGVDAPRIEVTLLRSEDRTWILSVADNGPWIDDERFESLFKPLQTTKGSAGMGLGLSIVSSIAERHAGHIEVARNGQSGLKFSIFIPGSATETETKPVELKIYSGDPTSKLTTAVAVSSEKQNSSVETIAPKESSLRDM